jgi:hypothetical protein
MGGTGREAGWQEWMGRYGWRRGHGSRGSNEAKEPSHCARLEISKGPGPISKVPTLDESDSDASEEEMQGGVEDLNGVRHLYHEQTWTKHMWEIGKKWDMINWGK